MFYLDKNMQSLEYKCLKRIHITCFDYTKIMNIDYHIILIYILTAVG